MSTILLIEDDDLLQELYKSKLADEGFEVVVTSDGRGGLDLIKSQKFDLILLDIMLPGGINGFDVLENIKKDKAFSKIPVIVLTNLEGEEKTAREIGAVDYFTKTKVSPNEIIGKIKEILKKKE
jgi:two-component system alkaline phosphatase synthesis response regulator PhoP